MKTNVLEVVIGAVVIVAASFFLYFAYVTSGEKIKDGYTLTAKFEDVSGLTEGADVKINGIKVGIVKSLKLDEDYSAKVELTIKNEYKIPDDSSLAITTDGIMGNKFIAVSTGYSDKYLEQDAEVEDTKSSVNLEGIIDKVISGFISKPSAEKASDKNDEETNKNDE
ncbi:MAG: outer membrane lipid asymmetry maintenance protein MlaD [Alphaproteobacteria bacterium]|nr:outer membrane lipid asymmetry maintenance protein MlaD [Alphaproteobacteria bacterium]